MAVNLSGLANNIENFIQGVGADLGILGGNEGQLYARDKDIDAVLSRTDNFGEAWNKLPRPYSFAVFSNSFGGPDQSFGFSPFELPIAPNSINQSEDFAISIKPTQGGAVVSHSGNKYKTLSITGTTGVNPFRGASGVSETTGKAIAKPNSIKFKSGYEVFIQLRNWFKSYYEFKKTGGLGSDARLVFRNFKDGEFLVVELLKFNMKRQAERAFLYDYEMEFKVLAHFNFTPPEKSFFEELDDVINSVIDKIDTARGIFLGTQEVLRNVESTYNATVIEPMRKIGLAAKAFAGVGITAADIGPRIIKNTVSAAASLNIINVIKEELNNADTGQGSVPPSYRQISLPDDAESAVANRGAEVVTDLDQALLDVPLSEFPAATNEAMAAEIDDSLNLSRSFYENAIGDLTRIKNNTEDFLNLGSDQYDNLFDRTATLSAESTKIATNSEIDLLNGFNLAISALNTLIASQALFKSDFQSKIDSIQSNFADNLNLQALPVVEEIIMPGNTNLERLALAELGSASRWMEIAELNDLQAPYVVQDQSSTLSNVVKPGDRILIPRQARFGPPEVPPAKEIPSTRGLSVVEKSLGTDLMLDENRDLALANNGDLSVISGAKNIAQAIVLKIAYEKGELLYNPSLGTGAQVGSKFNELTSLRDNFVSTLLQDPRISGVSNVQFRRESSALFVSFEVRIKQVDRPIPLTVKL